MIHTAILYDLGQLQDPRVRVLATSKKSSSIQVTTNMFFAMCFKNDPPWKCASAIDDVQALPLEYLSHPPGPRCSMKANETSRVVYFSCFFSFFCLEQGESYTTLTRGRGTR